MFSKMCGTVVCGLLLGYGGANAQINLMANLITFRDPSSLNTFTIHYGEFDASGSYQGGYFTGNTVGATLAGGTTGANINGFKYGVNANAYPNDLGASTYGGYFLSPRLGSGGIYDGTQTCVGVYGYGQGGGSSSTYYAAGVEASAEGSNSAALYAHGGSYAGYFDGSVNVQGVVSSYGQALISDKKLKTDINPLSSSLDKILLLQPKTYFFDTITYKRMNLPKTKQIGLVAQDVETIFPELVTEMKTLNFAKTIDSTFTDNHGKLVHVAKIQIDSSAQGSSIDTIKTVNYTALIPILITALQEQQKEIDALRNEKK